MFCADLLQTVLHRLTVQIEPQVFQSDFGDLYRSDLQAVAACHMRGDERLSLIHIYANIPYKKVVSWWGEQADAADVPLYVLHFSSKACSEETGWTEYDQLALQLIASEDLAGFTGDMYDDLSRFKQDLEGSTQAVLDYYDDTLNRQHILTELAVTSPAQKTYTTFEQTVTFMGASDPGAKITINDQEITTDENGYFTLNIPLSEGLNKFVFTHKGKTDVYNLSLIHISPFG